jgi:hypothetical protein
MPNSSDTVRPSRQPGGLKAATSRLALQRRLDALFRALASDFLLREQFVTDPSQVTAEYVMGKRIAPENAAALNHLIYSTLSSQRMIQWCRRYAIAQTRADKINHRQFIRDFSHAAAHSGASQVVEGLATLALSPSAIRLEDAWLQVIFGPWLRGEDGTGDTGTDVTDTTGTDVTGTDTTGTDVTGTGTDVTGTGTDITGTDITGTDITGTDITGTDITGTDITGTDITGITGITGTDITGTLTAITWSTYITGTGTGTFGTGTFTEATTPFTHTGITRSPFTTYTTDRGPMDPYFFGMSYVVVALDALTTYARQLQKAGELSRFWEE